MKKFEYNFPRPSIATDIAIFTIKNDVLSIVLIERKEEPFGWALPGGFLRPDENLEDCARRETEEETGVEPERLFHFGTFSEPGRDPRTWVVSVAYFTLMNLNTIQLSAGSDAASAKIFEVNDLPILAFDHKQVVNDAIASLSEKIARSPIALNMIVQPFTLSELKEVYSLLGMREHRTKGNFYRFAKLNLIDKGLIVEAGGTRSIGRQRPAKLYHLA